jgi:tRNA/rRNA methyltransferase
MAPPLSLDHIAIVLHRPRFAENIGSTARAAWNMGFSRIVLVDPQDTDWDRMSPLATHVARRLLENMEIHSDLSEALGPFQYIIGTTARLGGQRKGVITPKEAAEKIASLGPETRIALLFGPEDKGLTNAELRLCQALVTIPTARPGSLNLAQAVLILLYETFLAHRRGVPLSLPYSGKRPLATSAELEGMYAHLAEVLKLMDFLDKQNPELRMMSLRRFFSRIELTDNEVRMVRGICRQLRWFILKHRPAAGNRE